MDDVDTPSLIESGEEPKKRRRGTQNKRKIVKNMKEGHLVFRYLLSKNGGGYTPEQLSSYIDMPAEKIREIAYGRLSAKESAKAAGKVSEAIGTNFKQMVDTATTWLYDAKKEVKHEIFPLSTGSSSSLFTHDLLEAMTLSPETCKMLRQDNEFLENAGIRKDDDVLVNLSDRKFQAGKVFCIQWIGKMWLALAVEREGKRLFAIDLTGKMINNLDLEEISEGVILGRCMWRAGSL